MKKFNLLAVIGVVFILLNAASAQRFDLAVGAGTLVGSAPTFDTSGNLVANEGGGTYLNFSGTLLIMKNMGFNGEVAWRAKQNLYGGVLPFRPILFDFNGIYSPMLGKHAGIDAMAGIGVSTSRFYTGVVSGNPFSGYTNYQSSNHFMGHVGGGIRLYMTRSFFVRPEAHLYLVHNNFEYSNSHPVRVGISLGYSLGAQQD